MKLWQQLPFKLKLKVYSSGHNFTLNQIPEQIKGLLWIRSLFREIYISLYIERDIDIKLTYELGLVIYFNTQRFILDKIRSFRLFISFYQLKFYRIFKNHAVVTV